MCLLKDGCKIHLFLLVLISMSEIRNLGRHSVIICEALCAVRSTVGNKTLQYLI